VFESRRRGSTFVRGTDRWLVMAGVGALVLGLVLRLLTDIGRSTSAAPPPESRLPNVAMPGAPAALPTTAETLAATVERSEPPSPGAAAKPVRPLEAAPPAPGASPARTAAPAAADSPPARPAATRPAAVPSGGGWSVQLGTFGQQANAEKLRSEVDALGYRTATETISTASGAMHRVRAVGFADATAARRAADSIASATGTRGLVARPR
jgi:DedD protein